MFSPAVIYTKKSKPAPLTTWTFVCTEERRRKGALFQRYHWPYKKVQYRKRRADIWAQRGGFPRSSWFSLLLSPEQKSLDARIYSQNCNSVSRYHFPFVMSLHTRCFLFISSSLWLLSQERRRKGCRECMKYLHIISFCECRARERERKRYGREQKEKRQPQVAEIKRWKNADTGTKIKHIKTSREQFLSHKW